MLAHTADDLGDALDRLGRMAVERKLDGVRVQLHKRGGEVRVFTRRRNEITCVVPELVEADRAVHADAAVLDGETLALDAGG